MKRLQLVFGRICDNHVLFHLAFPDVWRYTCGVPHIKRREVNADLASRNTENAHESFIIHSSSFSVENVEFDFFLDAHFLNEDFAPHKPPAGNALQSPYHNHTHHEIIIILSGSGTLRDADNAITLHENDAGFIPKNCTHSTTFERNTRYLPICFDYKQSKQDQKKEAAPDYFNTLFSGLRKLAVPDSRPLIDIVAQLKSRIKTNTIMSQFSIKTLFQEFLIALCDSLSRSLGAAIPKSENRQYAKLFYAINQEMNVMSDSKKLKDIAAEFFISERQLSRLIKQLYGMSYRERKNKLRIETCKKLLAETSMPMSKILLELGMPDSPSFTAQFKKRTGYSPMEYRKKFGKNTD